MFRPTSIPSGYASMDIYSSSCTYAISTVKPALSGLLEIDEIKILMTNGSLMKVESIAGAFCNTFDLH